MVRIPRDSNGKEYLWFRAIFRHAGHTQLLVRCLTALGHASLSLGLVFLGIDLSHSPFIAFFQLVSATSLAIQYKTADDHMFVVRACASLGRVGLLIHAAACGRTWLPECDARPWKETDIRLALRIAHLFGAVRLFLNARSLLLQFVDPSSRPILSRGHPQLKYRSKIRATGTPLYIFRAVYKATVLQGTRFARTPYEISTNVVRAVLLIPVDAWSLRKQWKTPPSKLATSSAASMHDVLKIEPPKQPETREHLFWVLGHSRSLNDIDDEVDGGANIEDGSDDHVQAGRMHVQHDHSVSETPEAPTSPS